VARTKKLARKGTQKKSSVASWSLRKFRELSAKQQNTYFRAKSVISKFRKGKSEGKSASQVARENKTTLATVHRYFPKDLTKIRGTHRWKVSTSDNMHVNQLSWIGPNGYEPFLLRGTKNASRLGFYFNDVKRALRGGASALDKWHDKKIGGRKLITDMKVLMRLADEGKLDSEDQIQWRS
jgi:hypothetical protein